MFKKSDTVNKPKFLVLSVNRLKKRCCRAGAATMHLGNANFFFISIPKSCDQLGVKKNYDGLHKAGLDG